MTKKSMRILLVNDNSAHENWGAQATPYALRGILRGAMPGAAIGALPHAWLRRAYRRTKLFGALFDAESWRGIRPILHRLSTEAEFFPEVADEFDFWADEWMAGRGGRAAREFLDLAGRADIVVYNGENSIYRNTVEGCHGLFLLYLAKTRLEKASCIVNHTAQLDDVRPIMNGMVRLVDPLLDLVAVREPCSLRNLQAIGIKDAEAFPDVAFAIDVEEEPRGPFDAWRMTAGLDGGRYFCLSASGLPVSMPKGQWDGEVTALVRELKASGLQAVLVAKDPWCQPLAEVARRTDSLFFGPEHGFADLWPLFEGATFLVTGHYHYVIFAAMVGCPFIPLSANNHKMQGVCEQLEWRRTAPFDATWLRSCGAEIVKEAAELRENRPRLSAQLLERSAALRKEARRLGARVAEVATRPKGAAQASGGVSR
jgi:hypothetical protein